MSDRLRFVHPSYLIPAAEAPAVGRRPSGSLNADPIYQTRQGKFIGYCYKTFKISILDSFFWFLTSFFPCIITAGDKVDIRPILYAYRAITVAQEKLYAKKAEVERLRAKLAEAQARAEAQANS